MPIPMQPNATSPDADWEELLHTKGLRATRAAVSALKSIHSMEKPISHDDLLQYLGQQNPSALVDSVTLYRILDRLSQAKLIEKVLGSDRIWRYTVAGQRLHGFYECESCHQHFNLPRSSPLVTLLEQFSTQLKRKGDTAFAISFNVQGKCHDCS
jgi:Fur family ferric uptake transcriptional regulator